MFEFFVVVDVDRSGLTAVKKLPGANKIIDFSCL
jgi:hypothetical protein